MNKTRLMFIAALFSSAEVNAEIEARTAQKAWSCDIREENKADQENFESCWYFGAGLGFTYLDPTRNESSWRIEDKSDTGWLVYGGYHFKPDWFAEIAYQNMGDVSAIDRNPLRNLSGEITYTVPTFMVGYYFDLPALSKNIIPQTPLDTFLKLGVSSIDTQPEPGAISVNKNSEIQFAFGFGVEWRFHRNWKLRSQYETFDVDAHFLNLSVAYIFGHDEVAPVPHRAVEEPIDNVVIEEKSPQIATAVCALFSGSLKGVNFKSASDELTEEAIEILLKAIKELNAYPDMAIEIHAHTDWQGRALANQALSDRRALSVKTFMINSGISDERLSAVGHGEVQPVSDNRTIQGRAENRRVELRARDKSACE